jgi:hypothetical protein
MIMNDINFDQPVRVTPELAQAIARMLSAPEAYPGTTAEDVTRELAKPLDDGRGIIGLFAADALRYAIAQAAVGDPALARAAVLSETDDLTNGGDPRLKTYLVLDSNGDVHQIELAGDGLRYLAELLARTYARHAAQRCLGPGTGAPRGRARASERARRELARRGIWLRREGA